jgi:hypothetical protein
MAMFMKLLPVSMVANSFCGLDSSCFMALSLLLSFSSFFMSEGLSEKNATSEADMKADANSSIMVIVSDSADATVNPKKKSDGR